MSTDRYRIHLAVVIGVYTLLATRFAFVCDDAFISYRFAQNLASGRGLVFNPGEFPPVEGYSNFGWIALAFAIEALGMRPDRLLPAFSALCGAVLVARTYRVLRTRLDVEATPALWGTLTVAASPAMGCWATGGLETMPLALGMWWLFERVVIDRWDRVAAPSTAADGSAIGPALAAIALVLLRTEGIAWVCVVLGASIVARLVDRAPMRPHLAFLARIVVPVAAVFVAFTAWRFHFYGTFVPNTVLVKVDFGLAAAVRGLKYVGLFLATALVPLVALAMLPAVARTERRGTWAAIASLVAALYAYAIAVGGDFMPFGRLLVPSVAPVGLIVAGGLQQIARRSRGRMGVSQGVGVALVIASVLPAIDLHLVPDFVRRKLHFRLSDRAFLSELNRWHNQRENTAGFTRRGRALAQIASPDDAVVAAAVGAVGYWSGITVYDLHGLVTPEVARRPLPDGPLTQSPGHDKHVEPSFFVKYEPRFLYARAVEGILAAGRMKDTLDQWRVPDAVKDRYVPDYYEVAPIGAGPEGASQRAFLFVVRLKTPNEDPAKLWEAFPGRRRALNAQLRSGEGAP